MRWIPIPPFAFLRRKRGKGHSAQSEIGSSAFVITDFSDLLLAALLFILLGFR
ncbi:Uncharacterised protein [Vibrio cholerae]|nr:Uncharacterised protein [Vibrio cholerae]